MADRHGDWIWYELLTSDAAASTALNGVDPQSACFVLTGQRR